MAKKVPNPNGKKGGDKHQELQESKFEELLSAVQYDGEGTLVVAKEVPISTLGGKKLFRIADVAAYVLKYTGIKQIAVWLRIVQIGKTENTGDIPCREREAINDIETATGISVEFYDYETKKRIK